jgi:hypothetical protein
MLEQSLSDVREAHAKFSQVNERLTKDLDFYKDTVFLNAACKGDGKHNNHLPICVRFFP